MLNVNRLMGMNTLKAVQCCFRNHTRTNLSHNRPRKSRGTRNSTICFSSSNGSDDSSSSSSPDGYKRKQELLAQIAMLQAQKLRLTDFLDERSAHLTQFAEEANSEFDAIGENARKELDDAGTRIMENLEGRMQAFEEETEMNRHEIEKNEKVLEEFEEQIVRNQNEGLFFKNLQPKASQKKPSKAKSEAEKLGHVTIINNGGSKTRRNIYLALMCLLILAIGNALFASPEVEWWKVAALALIMIGLLAQFIYEKSLSSTSDEISKKN